MPMYPGARRVISIDPGLGGTGWAYWKTHKYPAAVGIVRDTAKDESLAIRCSELAGKLKRSIDAVTGQEYSGWHNDETYMFIELPQHMAHAAGVAAQAGAIYKLTFLVGYIACAIGQCRVIVVNPSEWKGQTPKDVIQRRIIRTLGQEKCNELGIKTHAWDAVGIGLWAMGRL